MTVFREKDIPVIYPSSDGKPMAENTVQFNWLVKIKQGLEKTTKDQNTFVAGDLFWYPVEGDNKTRLAPDVMVAVGRPKGDRGSYLQWREDHIPPQLVIEILSPGNRPNEMKRKLAFYEKYGVQEYVIYNPKKNHLTVYERIGDRLVNIDIQKEKWVSAYLGISMQVTDETLTIFHPSGEPFISNEELEAAYQQSRIKASREEEKAARYAAKLRALGIDPESL